MNKNKFYTIMFSIFAVIMAVLHFILCNFKIRASQIFAQLNLSSNRTVDEQQWAKLINDSNTVGTVYYLLGIVFFIFIGYRLIYRKISFPYVLISTFVAYLVMLIPILSLFVTEKSVGELLVPISVSLGSTLFIIASAAIKRHQYEKLQKKFQPPV